jgi:hypothetical protein
MAFGSQRRSERHRFLRAKGDTIMSKAGALSDRVSVLLQFDQNATEALRQWRFKNASR